MINKIKKDALEARKNKDELKTGLLTTLVSEITMKAKNDGNREITELDCISTIKKFIKNAEECNSNDEIEVLNSYLPQQISEEELSKIIDSYISLLDEKAPKSMGIVMKQLKQNYDGKYDGKIASTLVKSKLL